ncbi:MAG TPA: type II secretion system F family protein [Acidimicrobiia bacterium]|nr:type II secretion system F family protein [Acidimicrobiia bacterium]
MRVVIVGVIGCGFALFFAGRARRFAVADRLRVDSRASRRVPDWLYRRVEQALAAAALEVSPERALSTWMWAVLVAGVVGIGFAGPAVALGFVVVVAIAVPVTVLMMHDRLARRIASAVPETLERVASELRSGGTVATAIAGVVRSDGPLASDMARVDTRVRLGASLTQALGAWSHERAVAGVDASAGALAMCSTAGGRSADALDGLATSLRDRLGVAAEARALSSQARMSAFVVGGAPVAYIAWSAFVDPHALHILTGTLFGRACLVVGLGLEALGGWWMRSIVRTGSGA